MTTRTSAARARHEAWLLDLTALPTAAGREGRVIAWIEAWVRERDDLRVHADGAGNLVIERVDADRAEQPPLFITAHLDHPAFVVERIEGRRLHCTFRGGVRSCYFQDAAVVVFTEDDRPVRARVAATEETKPIRTAILELASGEEDADLAPGNVGRWDLPEPEIAHGMLHAHACDDLAAVAAALAALDELRAVPEAGHVRLLLTRAEEIGFIGAIAACTTGTIPRDARLVLLENSRSYAESPIGGGPIVRVGDRLSTFTPELTAAICGVAARLAGEGQREPGDPAAGPEEPAFRWQRRLMPGGACESTCYMAYGYASTCVCLPLGNYHNMADLELVLEGDADAIANARPAREHIAIADFHGLVDLLVACGTDLAPAEPLRDRMDRLFAERGHVLDLPSDF